MIQSPKELLDTLLGYLGFICEIEESQTEAGIFLQVLSSESERLIGHDGETMEQIQYLLNRLLFAEDKSAPRVQIDINHYRAMRRDALVAKVQKMSESVRATGIPVRLDAMNSYERRIVHNVFQDDPEVQCVSPNDDARIKRMTLKRRQPAS